MRWPLKSEVGYKLAASKWSKTPAQAPLAFNCQIDLMVFFKGDRFPHPSMAENVIACRSSPVIYPHLPLSLSHFQNSLSTFSIERVNEIPLWDFCASDFQRLLEIIIIAELFIVMTMSPGQLRHINSNNAENAHSRSYVLKISSIIRSVFVTHIPAFANSCCNI